MKRFKVIALHPTNICDLDCPFCYVNKDSKTPPNKIFYELPKYLVKLTNQVAVGGGEIFLFPEFIKKFSKLCKMHHLICNVTTNGRKLMKMSDVGIKSICKDLTMVSVSFDKYKIRSLEDMRNYFNLVKRLKKLTKLKVGCNLLVDNNMFKKHNFTQIVATMFRNGVDMVYALYPKNMPRVSILKHKADYYALSVLFKGDFFVDDATKMILEERGYRWKHPCHFGKYIISIDNDLTVKGCSFDTVGVLKLKKPEDIMKVLSVRFEERFKCPYAI